MYLKIDKKSISRSFILHRNNEMSFFFTWNEFVDFYFNEYEFLQNFMTGFFWNCLSWIYIYKFWNVVVARFQFTLEKIPGHWKNSYVPNN